MKSNKKKEKWVKVIMILRFFQWIVAIEAREQRVLKEIEWQGNGKWAKWVKTTHLRIWDMKGRRNGVKFRRKCESNI